MKVLIVDDEPDIRRIARLGLTRVGGMEVVEATSGAEALVKAKEEHPDAVLLDVMMPGLDGPSTLASLREDPATAGIPVVFLTAKAIASEVDRLKSLGAAGVLDQALRPHDPGRASCGRCSASRDRGLGRRARRAARRCTCARRGGRLDDLDRLLDAPRAGRRRRARRCRTCAAASTASPAPGATYGLPAVSALGLEGERLLRRPCARGRPSPPTCGLARDGGGAARGDRPARPAAPAAQPAPASSAPPTRARGRRGRRRRARRWPAPLEQEGFAVRAAPRLADALRPGRAPARRAHRRRRRRPGRGLRPGGAAAARGRAATRPVVLVVARHGGVLDRVEAIHCGADGHFTKPVDVGALVRRLRFLLERERAEPPRILSVEDDPPAGGLPAHGAHLGRLRGARRATTRRGWSPSWPPSGPTSCSWTSSCPA